MSSRAEQKAAARQAREEAEAAEAAAAQRKRRLGILGGVLAIAVVAVVVALVVSGGSSSTKTPAQVKAKGNSINALFAGIPQNGFVLGKSSAPVTAEEFIDPQCPYCKEFSQQALPTVVRDYVRTGKVKLVLRPLAFIGPDSVTAAQTLVGASKQDKAWPFLDLFYANQGQENSGYVTDAFLRKIGGAVAGLDIAKAIEVGKTDPSVANTLSQVDTRAKTVGANSTPTIVLTGKGGQSVKAQLDPNDYTGSITKALDAASGQ